MLQRGILRCGEGRVAASGESELVPIRTPRWRSNSATVKNGRGDIRAVDAGQWALLGVLLASSLPSIACLLVVPLRAFSSGAGDGTDGRASQIQEARYPASSPS